jgi:hypothetical protein
MHRAYKRVLDGTGHNMASAAAVFVLLRLSRDEFIALAGMAYDFMENWHQKSAKEEQEKRRKRDSSPDGPEGNMQGVSDEH